MRNLIIILVAVCLQCTTSNDQDETYQKPDSNRFEIELMAEDLNEPMSMDIASDGRIFFIERKGTIKIFDPVLSDIETIGHIPVNTRFSEPFTTSGKKYDADDGMHGIAIDPDFAKNGFIYLYYSPQTENPISQVVRYTYKEGSLDLTSKKVLLEWRTQRERCCHWGGGMVFDQDKNLLIAIGDNSGFSISMKTGDPRRTSGNSNDLRGSILRIKPELDGTYSIPKGNLFSKGMADTRPEIYIIGVRNPWRLNMDSKTGWIYWGEVGPSMDEFNLAKEAGNYGWPFYLGDNNKYLNIDTEYDTTSIINDSPYNSGLVELPSPPVPALVWYDRSPSKDFPVPGSGSLNAVGGPIYRKSDFTNSERPYPFYYEGKWFVTDYVRGWIMVIEVDEDGNYTSMEEFMPEGTFKGGIDMKFGVDGDLYVLQYGHDSYEPYAKDAKLYRIKYNSGNRAPIAKASANITNGSVPLEVELSARSSIDYDNNIVQYEWSVMSNNGETMMYQGETPIVSIDKEGIYNAILTVIDSEGAYDTDTVEIIAGNSAPKINIDFIGSNKSFYFPGDEITYAVTISDEEDEELEDSRINIWSDYLPQGYGLDDFIGMLKDSSTYLPARSILGEQLIKRNNCYQCHSLDKTSVGPSYTDVASLYGDGENVYQDLSDKIIGGSVGTWGVAEMPAHPAITEDEAKSIVDFILNATKMNHIKRDLPLSGNISVPEDHDAGQLVFKASYRDKGNNKLPSIETVEIEVLRDPKIFIEEVDTSMGMRIYIPHFKQKNHLITKSSNAFIGISNIDYTGIKEIGLEIIDLDKLKDSNWVISVRSGSSDGTLLGRTKIEDLIKIDKGIGRLKINELSEESDLYIVLTNEEGDNRKREVEIRSILFYKK